TGAASVEPAPLIVAGVTDAEVEVSPAAGVVLAPLLSSLLDPPHPATPSAPVIAATAIHVRIAIVNSPGRICGPPQRSQGRRPFREQGVNLSGRWCLRGRHPASTTSNPARMPLREPDC